MVDREWPSLSSLCSAGFAYLSFSHRGCPLRAQLVDLLQNLLQLLQPAVQSWAMKVRAAGLHCLPDPWL